MALVGNILLSTSTAPAVSSIASSVASAVASAVAEDTLSSKIPWGALEYSGTVITAISGSAIGGQGGGGGDTSQCMPISGMTAYQPISSISAWTADMSAISAKQDKLTFGYDGDKISSIDGSALAGGNVTPSDVSSVASSYAVSAASGKQDSSAMTGYLQNSASSLWYPYTGNPSGFLTQHQSLAGYVPKSSISAQSSIWNTVSAMVPKSSISGNSATWNTVSAMVPKSSISAQSSTWNTVSAMVPKSSISSQSSTWNTVSAMVPKSSISAQSSTWNTVSAMTPKSSISAKSATWNTVTAKVDKSAISSWSSNFVYKSAVSGWSAQIAALSAAISSITANKYTLSAGAGIAITNNTATKVTIISAV